METLASEWAETSVHGVLQEMIKLMSRIQNEKRKKNLKICNDQMLQLFSIGVRDLQSEMLMRFIRVCCGAYKPVSENILIL